MKVPVSEWDRIFSVNVRGTFLCYKYAAKQMIAQGRGGRIMGACSGAGKQAKKFMSVYGSSKFALRGLTQATGDYRYTQRSRDGVHFVPCISFAFLTVTSAQELGEHGITCNLYAVCFLSFLL
jgi:NAD(P)-dependent dehydrogenase (short-subunit alcohol dehydrogenase family)